MNTMPGRPSVLDASLIQSHVLPAAESLETETDPIDIGTLHGISARTELDELVLSYPDLALASLPNGSVITYTIEACASSVFGAEVITLATATQTGATAKASQPGGDLRSKLPSDCPQYVRGTARTDSAGADCSAASMTLQIAV